MMILRAHSNPALLYKNWWKSSLGEWGYNEETILLEDITSFQRNLFIIFPQTLHSSEDFLSPVFPWLLRCHSDWVFCLSGMSSFEKKTLTFSPQASSRRSRYLRWPLVTLIIPGRKSWHSVWHLQLTILFTFIYTTERKPKCEWGSDITRWQETTNSEKLRLRRALSTVSRLGMWLDWRDAAQGDHNTHNIHAKFPCPMKFSI